MNFTDKIAKQAAEKSAEVTKTVITEGVGDGQPIVAKDGADWVVKDKFGNVRKRFQSEEQANGHLNAHRDTYVNESTDPEHISNQQNELAKSRDAAIRIGSNARYLAKDADEAQKRGDTVAHRRYGEAAAEMHRLASERHEHVASMHQFLHQAGEGEHHATGHKEHGELAKYHMQKARDLAKIHGVDTSYWGSINESTNLGESVEHTRAADRLSDEANIVHDDAEHHEAAAKAHDEAMHKSSDFKVGRAHQIKRDYHLNMAHLHKTMKEETQPNNGENIMETYNPKQLESLKSRAITVGEHAERLEKDSREAKEEGDEYGHSVYGASAAAAHRRASKLHRMIAAHHGNHPLANNKNHRSSYDDHMNKSDHHLQRAKELEKLHGVDDIDESVEQVGTPISEATGKNPEATANNTPGSNAEPVHEKKDKEVVDQAKGETKTTTGNVDPATVNIQPAGGPQKAGAVPAEPMHTLPDTTAVESAKPAGNPLIEMASRSLTDSTKKNPAKPVQSPEYQLGYKKSQQPHYWAHTYNSDLDKHDTLEKKVDFHNGYHDGLADKFKFDRSTPVRASDLKDHRSLYQYND